MIKHILALAAVLVLVLAAGSARAAGVAPSTTAAPTCGDGSAPTCAGGEVATCGCSSPPSAPAPAPPKAPATKSGAGAKAPPAPALPPATSATPPGPPIYIINMATGGAAPAAQPLQGVVPQQLPPPLPVPQLAPPFQQPLGFTAGQQGGGSRLTGLDHLAMVGWGGFTGHLVKTGPGFNTGVGVEFAARRETVVFALALDVGAEVLPHSNNVLSVGGRGTVLYDPGPGPGGLQMGGVLVADQYIDIQAGAENQGRGYCASLRGQLRYSWQHAFVGADLGPARCKIDQPVVIDGQGLLKPAGEFTLAGSVFFAGVIDLLDL